VAATQRGPTTAEGKDAAGEFRVVGRDEFQFVHGLDGGRDGAQPYQRREYQRCGRDGARPYHGGAARLGGDTEPYQRRDPAGAGPYQTTPPMRYTSTP
jgi:hypothetical protein